MSDQFQDTMSKGREAAARRLWAEAERCFGEAQRLQPASAEAAFNLGRIVYIGGDVARSMSLFTQAVTADPLHIKALTALVQCLTEAGREPDAVAAAAKGLSALRARADVAPASYNLVYSHMAHAYRRLHDLPRAAECYRAMLAANPADTVTQHLLAAAEGKLTQAYAADFAKAFFDNLAGTFDKHLVQKLDYAAPQVLAVTLHEMRADKACIPAVLDLGCGTGLMGQALAPHFRVTRLVGIDLSANMLREAEKRALYSEVIQGDIAAVLSGRDEPFNLITAADVFIYMGDLAPVFTQAARLLRPDGLFAFSVEISPSDDIELQSNGHYRHGRSYIARLAAEHGFNIARAADAPVRKEAGEDVMGYYVYLTKVHHD